MAPPGATIGAGLQAVWALSYKPARQLLVLRSCAGERTAAARHRKFAPWHSTGLCCSPHGAARNVALPPSVWHVSCLTVC